jgi:hypothetical protein
VRACACVRACVCVCVQTLLYGKRLSRPKACNVCKSLRASLKHVCSCARGPAIKAPQHQAQLAGEQGAAHLVPRPVPYSATRSMSQGLAQRDERTSWILLAMAAGPAVAGQGNAAGRNPVCLAQGDPLTTACSAGLP